MTPILTIENLRVEIPVKAGLLKAVRGVDLAKHQPVLGAKGEVTGEYRYEGSVANRALE